MLPTSRWLFCGQRPKTGRCTWSVRGQNMYVLKSSEKYTLQAPPGPDRIVPDYHYGRIKPRYTRVCLLCLMINRFYIPHTNAEVRGDPLHPSHPTPRHTSNTRICLHTSAEIHTYDTLMPICTMATGGSVSAASEIEEGSICPTMQEFRAAAVKQEDMYQCC